MVGAFLLDVVKVQRGYPSNDGSHAENPGDKSERFLVNDFHDDVVDGVEQEVGNENVEKVGGYGRLRGSSSCVLLLRGKKRSYYRTSSTLHYFGRAA